MLSIFPIQFLSLLAYFILRVTVGALLMFLAYRHTRDFPALTLTFSKRWWPFGQFSTLVLIATELTCGLLIVIGMYTQVATLIVALMSIKLFLIRPWYGHPSIPSRLFYLLLAASTLCLTITGAGAFAADLPL